MLRMDKVLWEDIIKLLSFQATENWLEELALNDIYDEELSEIARDVIDPRQLPHYETDTFDIWNTYIEKALPVAYLDKVEEIIDEDRACDVEDYFLYMQKRAFYGNVFNFWNYIFNDYYTKNPDVLIINPEIDDIIKKYIEYVNNVSEKVNNTEITDDWDLYINSLYIPDLEDMPDDENPVQTCPLAVEEQITYSYISELIAKFIFLDVSFDFWSRINEYDESVLIELKDWATENYGDETEPVVPIINDYEEEDTDE